ncbi:zinc finger protein 335 isoform X2 [Coregonus clupeaformis]|uniref:zinc finger protein 335 isoform X2 n=1 Tax=Coregonus clupeaformis TaxID=59861 RepID=UPI001E1C999F|nr:zinc finger protein 335 isoform X2 [Coregonus clupeaformis]
MEEEIEVESSSDVGPSGSGMEEPSESGMGMESSEAMSADSSDAAAPHASHRHHHSQHHHGHRHHSQAPESDCHVGQSSEGVLVFLPETSSSTDVTHHRATVHLPDSSSVAQSTSVSTVTQSILVSGSAQVTVHSSAAGSDCGGMMVSDSTASTSTDLGSAIDKIIESTIGPGFRAVTSAEDGTAETSEGQYLILQGPDDGAPMVAHMSSSALSSHHRIAIEALGEGPTSTCHDQGDMQGNLDPDQPSGSHSHSGHYPDHEDQDNQPQHSHASQYMECSGGDADGPDQTGESSSSYVDDEEPDQTRTSRSLVRSRFPEYGVVDNSDQDLRGYVECSGSGAADSNPSPSSPARLRHTHYMVDCSAGTGAYLECAGDEEEDSSQHHSRSYIDSSSSANHSQSHQTLPNHSQSHQTLPNHSQSHQTLPNHSQSHQTLPNHSQSHHTLPNHSQSHQTLRQYVESGAAIADSEQPGCSNSHSQSHQTLRQYMESGAADSEQPGCYQYQAEEGQGEDPDQNQEPDQNQDPDQPQHSDQQQPQHSHYMETTSSSTGPESSLGRYAGAGEGGEGSSTDHHHPQADTADSGTADHPEAMECSESQPGPYISSSGTYSYHPEPEVEEAPEPPWSPSLGRPSRGEEGGVVGGSGAPVVEGTGAGSGPGVPVPHTMAELEEMMEVVIVQQFKCKMCPYKSVSKNTLINHMRDRHFKPTGGPPPKKRGRGRPRRSDTLARQKAEVKPEPQPEEPEDDDIVDAGAIDDPEEDSDYNPADEDCRGRQPALLKQPVPPPCSSSSTDRPRRRVGRPRKFTYTEGSYNGKEAAADGMSKPKGSVDPQGSEEASSSGLGNGPGPLANGNAAEAGISQSDSENKDPSSNGRPEEAELFPRKRGRPSKRFIRKKYKKYMNRKYCKSLKPLLRPHNCWICGSRFLSQEDLRFHVDSHQGNDPECFKCLQCNYRCKRWSSLKEHMFNHQGNKPFKCEECDYSSVYKKDVIRHSAIHNKNKKTKSESVSKVLSFPCPVCHRVYPMQKRLTQHMKTHSTEKPHMCDKCGKSFKKRYTFKMHLLTHIQSVDNSRFKCEFCDYDCDNKKLLLNHQLSHTNDRPFKCDYCKYSTSKEDFLVSHLAIKHTGEKPFSCEMCHFMTKHRKNLRLHVQCRHPEAFEEWSATHPEEPVRRRRRPFFTLQQIEELKQQHDDTPGLQNTILAVDPETLQAMQTMQNASVSQDAMGNTTIIYEQAGNSDLSAQNALDLLLNMSNARELVGNSLQVQVLKSSDSKVLEAGSWTGVTSATGGGQKVVTFHVSETGETLVQEVQEVQEGYEAGTNENGEITQVAIQDYERAEGFSVLEQVEQATEEIHSTGPEYSSGEGSPQPMEEEEEGTEIVRENGEKFYLTSGLGDGVLQQNREKFYLTSGLGDGVLQQVELSSEAPGSPSMVGSPQQNQLNPKRFSCRICMESFHGRSDMENHKRAHIDPSTFKCPDCDFTASSWPVVKTHMGMHAYLRPHKCPSCSFASKNKKDLRRHMMTHTNEKPFTCQICGQRFNRNGHLKFHMERLHSQDPPTKKTRSGGGSQQTVIVNSDEEALATLQSALQAGQTITPEQLQQALGQDHIVVSQEQGLGQDHIVVSQEQGLGQDHIVVSQEQGLGQDHIIVSQEQGLGQDHIVVSQEQGLEDQVEATYIQQITTVDGQTLQYMTGDNQVQYIISQDGVQHFIPQEYVVLADGNHIQMSDGQIIQYEHDGAFLQEQQIALSHDGQIQYLPISSEQQIVSPEDLEVAEHSAVTAVADAALQQTQTVYTEATQEQLEQLQQQGIQYDVITFTDD